MNYLKELSIQLNKLNDADWIKINIHYNLNGELLTLCEKINSEVNSLSNGLICFGAKNITVPHISLYMGYVNDYAKIDQILENVYEYAKTLSSVRIDPTRLYLKSISKKSPKYLFLDVLQNEHIMSQKKHLGELLNNQIKPIEWDFLGESPHITVGCYKSISATAKKQIEKYHMFPYCEINEVAVSISGQRGVCLGNLKTFTLNHRE